MFKKIKDFFFPPKEEGYYSLSSSAGIKLRALPDLDGIDKNTYWGLDPVRTCYEVVAFDKKTVTIADIDSGKEHVFKRELFLDFFTRLEKPDVAEVTKKAP